jgi:hypothetical protein
MIFHTETYSKPPDALIARCHVGGYAGIGLPLRRDLPIRARDGGRTARFYIILKASHVNSWDQRASGMQLKRDLRWQERRHAL